MNPFGIANTIVNATAIDDLPGGDSDELYRIARQAYRLCCDWFGAPDDPNRSVDIVVGNAGIAFCALPLLSRRYWIVLNGQSDLLDLRRQVAHEMYHRVTLRRRGLRERFWVDEMLASAAALRTLEEAGVAIPSDRLPVSYLDAGVRADWDFVRRFGARKARFSMNTAVPEWYGGAVTLLGVGLERLVGWSGLCRLCTSRSWSGWLRTFEADEQIMVRRYLDFVPDMPQIGAMSDVVDASSLSQECVIKLAASLATRGELERALSLYNRALNLEPNSVKVLSRLGSVLFRSGRLDGALTKWQAALALSPDSTWLLFNIGVAYLDIGRSDLAIEYWRRVLEIDPSHASAMAALSKTQLSH